MCVPTASGSTAGWIPARTPHQALGIALRDKHQRSRTCDTRDTSDRSMGTGPLLVPKSNVIGGNPRLSVFRWSATQRVKAKNIAFEHRRFPASHPGGRRFESG